MTVAGGVVTAATTGAVVMACVSVQIVSKCACWTGVEAPNCAGEAPVISTLGAPAASVLKFVCKATGRPAKA